MSEEAGTNGTNGALADIPLRPGRNGGQLRSGGNGAPEYKQGGRPPSLIRQRLRKSLYRDIPFVDRIAAGKFMPKLPPDVDIADLCRCGAYEDYQAKPEDEVRRRRVKGKDCKCTCANNHLLLAYGLTEIQRAIDMKAKYSIGTAITSLDGLGNDAPIGPVIYMPDNGRSRTR